MMLPDVLPVETLLAAYRCGQTNPAEVAETVLARIEAAPEHHAWIYRLSRQQLRPYVEALQDHSPATRPLFGVPFAIKDNIDLAGVPTTSGCPKHARVPARSATVVQRLVAAGAIPVGKTNLDQFATGLVGARSPYGAGRNAFDPAYISGGSSSGSAIAVAQGLVSFALGTDTAGSGRVPAGFNNLVGLKPTCGLLSTTGVVPACRSLDCVSIFALTAADAAAVLEVAKGFDEEDPYSRREQDSEQPVGHALRFGVPPASQLAFFGDTDYAQCYDATVAALERMGGERVEVDCRPFFAAAQLLYQGPWTAERYAAVESLLHECPDALLPVTRAIIEAGGQPTAVDAFRAQYRLRALSRESEATWESVSALALPTAGTVYRIEEVMADPVRLNSNLGYYTNFVNLLDLAAVAVPAGFRADGLPFGVTLIGRAGTDSGLLALASRLHAMLDLPLGAGRSLRASLMTGVAAPASRMVPVAVCGAHMAGLPLNAQLTGRGARFVRSTRTAPVYRFYALPGGPPERPGLVRVGSGGVAVEVEVWDVPEARFGSFAAGIPQPLCIGKVLLDDGSAVPGFLCEAAATQDAQDISAWGSWRAWRARSPQDPRTSG